MICVKFLARKGFEIIMESLILAQNERWRRVLTMQVGRQCSNAREWRTGE
jgi:hypothetical protein